MIITSPGEKPEECKPLAQYDHLVIPTDCKVALQGATGCGKTTMIRAIKRFYPTSQGHISLFGKPLELYSQRELADLICYVPQSTFFFAGTIRDNLTYSMDDCEVTDAQLLEALTKSCLLDELLQTMEHPEDVLNIHVAEGAKNFSGGQRQRLALARAFLKVPRLYLLDESTANLDAATTDRVLSNIEKHASENHAGIVYISHDKHVVKRCDRILPVVNLLKTHSLDGVSLPKAS